MSREKIKTKLVAFRMEPELHAKLTALVAAANQDTWWNRVTVSSLLSDAAEDFASGDQKNLIKIRKQVKEQMRLVKKKGHNVLAYNFCRP